MFNTFMYIFWSMLSDFEYVVELYNVLYETHIDPKYHLDIPWSNLNDAKMIYL